MEFLTSGPFKLPTFGRTTAFGYLERIGGLRLLGEDFLPSRMYLEGSSGPLYGLSMVLTGSPLSESDLKNWLGKESVFTSLEEVGNELQKNVLTDRELTSAFSEEEEPRLLVEVLRDLRNFETSLCCFYEFYK